MPACDSDPTDIIFIVDSGCGAGEVDEFTCEDKWQFIAELMTSIKGTNNDNRVAVIQIDSVSKFRTVEFTNDYNDITGDKPTAELMKNFFQFLLTYDQCEGNNPGDQDQQLPDGIDDALLQFSERDPTELGRDKKIVVISNCFVDQTLHNSICNNYANTIRTEQIDLYSVILPYDSSVSPFTNDYLLCLADYDQSRIFGPTHDLEWKNTKDLIPLIEDHVCRPPSPAPTSDPTNDPTTDPTRDPTADPTTDPTNDPTTDPTTDPKSNTITTYAKLIQQLILPMIQLQILLQILQMIQLLILQMIQQEILLQILPVIQLLIQHVIQQLIQQPIQPQIQLLIQQNHH
eukprot:810804_1